MADAEKGLFQALVVKDISRFARNTVDLLQNIRKLKSLGIETYFLTANMTSMGNSEFVLTIFGALAQEESANMSKRIKFGKKVNAEKGRVPGFVYGYDKTKGDYYNLTINEKEADILHQIFDWYVIDGYGSNRIAGMLNDRGYKTKRNCKWSQNAVCRILTNEIYTGKIINGKQEVEDFLTGKRKENAKEEWIVIERPDLKIIEEETFKKAQEIMESHRHAFKYEKERHSNKHLFSTLIKCKLCGWSYKRITYTYKATHARWVCSGRNIHGSSACQNTVTIDEDELIEVLHEYFSELIKNKKNIIDYIVNKFQKIYKAKDENVNYEKELKVELSRLQKIRKKYMDMYTDDLISREELNDKIGGLRKNVEQIESELKLISQNITKGEQLSEILNTTFKEIESITDIREMTNAQLKEIIKKIEVDSNGEIHCYLRLFSDLGLNGEYLISDNSTYCLYASNIINNICCSLNCALCYITIQNHVSYSMSKKIFIYTLL